MIGRFISPDTVIPNPANPQCYNRYSYSLNNPLRYIDPSGHWPDRSLEGIPLLTLLEWASWGALLYGTTIYWDKVINDNGNLDTNHNFPKPYFNPWRSEPGQQQGDSNGIDPTPWLVGLIIVTLGTTVGITFGNLPQKADETGFPDPALPLKKPEESAEYHEVTFIDGSSGYYSSDCVTMMQQYGVSIETVQWTVSTQKITFSDGSSGYYTAEQIRQMQQMGVI